MSRSTYSISNGTFSKAFDFFADVHPECSGTLWTMKSFVTSLILCLSFSSLSFAEAKIFRVYGQVGMGDGQGFSFKAAIEGLDQSDPEKIAVHAFSASYERPMGQSQPSFQIPDRNSIMRVYHSEHVRHPSTTVGREGIVLRLFAESENAELGNPLFTRIVIYPTLKKFALFRPDSSDESFPVRELYVEELKHFLPRDKGIRASNIPHSEDPALLDVKADCNAGAKRISLSRFERIRRDIHGRASGSK